MPGEPWAHPFDGEGKSTLPPPYPCNVSVPSLCFCYIRELANELLLVRETMEGCLWKVLTKC